MARFWKAEMLLFQMAKTVKPQPSRFPRKKILRKDYVPKNRDFSKIAPHDFDPQKSDPHLKNDNFFDFFWDPPEVLKKPPKRFCPTPNFEKCRFRPYRRIRVISKMCQNIFCDAACNIFGNRPKIENPPRQSLRMPPIPKFPNFGRKLKFSVRPKKNPHFRRGGGFANPQFQKKF